MSYIITGEPSNWKNSNYDEKHGYEYPLGLDLRPDSDFHKSLRTKIWQRARVSRNQIQKRFSSWRKIDRTLTTYIPADDAEELLKDKEPKKPISIVFPYTYSMLEALLTYMSAAFFQDPVFQYEGVEDSDVLGAMLMELVVKVHCVKNKVILPLHTVLRDSLSYGIGIGVPEWRTRYGKKIVNDTFVNGKIFEGNALSNIDPYMFLPDPSVSSADIQKGEFVGWVDRDNYMNLLTNENNIDSGLFNVKYLKGGDKRSVFALDQSDRDLKFGTNKLKTDEVTTPVDIIKMYITLIPKDWGLGDEESPEKWYFELAGDDIIICCEKADHAHGMYPVAVASPEFDGYSPTPIGRLEILYGLQHTLDFLFNSHVENVRKAINDMLIVDPYLVNINDLKDPKPGKLIRLRRPAWGRGVDKVVQQLGVQDITRANIADSSYITQWMDRISGADQSMQGSLRQGGPERLTGAEFQGTRNSAISRLQRLAMIISTQFMQDIGEMFAAHTQQYMTEDVYVQLLGRYSDKLIKQFGGKTKANVSPRDLLVNYDLLVRDGSIPGGNFSDVWIQLFKTIGTNPELSQQFDVTRIFMYIANQLGAKNVEDFKRKAGQIQTSTMPDDQVASEAQAGNLVPVGGR